MTAEPHDRFARAQSVADAVLYEGYVLYPYRASSAKNRVRWQFGVLMPPAWCLHDPSERSSARAECLVRPGSSAALTVRIRFLHRQERTVEAPAPGRPPDDGRPLMAPVDRLEFDGEVHVPWDEATERSVDVGPVPLGPLLERGAVHPDRFVFHGGDQSETLRAGDGTVAGRVVRRRRAVRGQVQVAAEPVPGPAGLARVIVTVENSSADGGDETDRDGALGHALLALHAMVAVDDGTFVSLLDPPEGAETAAAECRSDGLHPVLVADDLVLAAPIILYDHPQVAPESPGDLFDATEIDEILALRVLTLTEDEKKEARSTDPRAAAVVDRCDGMAPEAWDRLHGTFRPVGEPDDRRPGSPAVDQPPAVAWWDPDADAGVDPFGDSVTVAGTDVRKGTPVRLHPSHRADAHDLFYRDQPATVAGVFRDVDDSVQVAVILDDDPAGDELAWQGRYLFFHPDEVEPLTGSAGPRR